MEAPKYIVAVVSLTLHDFCQWERENFKVKSNTLRSFISNENEKYFCITQIDQLRGFMCDEIIVLPNAELDVCSKQIVENLKFFVRK